MSGKAIFIDTTKCTACRGCQIACKQWNGLPATKTEQWGSHQNPRDLSAETWKLVRFSEPTGLDDRPVWHFFPDQCRHCLEPPCKELSDAAPGAIIIDKETGAVIHTKELSKSKVEDIRGVCPFDVPRSNPETNVFGKCTMCIDRISNGLVPACVKTCATGSMNFGDWDKMVTLAKERFEARKKLNPKAHLTGLEELRVFYLFDDKPETYYHYADASSVLKLNQLRAMKRVMHPIRESASVKLLKSLFG